MALTGPPAKPQKLGHSATADWTDVPDTPYDGPWPVELPKQCGRKKWHDMVLAWWEEVRRMPHCSTWADTDWRFALETAYMKQQLWSDYNDGQMKSTAWTELRRREDQMGYTVEARRKLRIRYVDPESQKRRQAGLPVNPADGNVVALEDRRSRLTG